MKSTNNLFPFYNEKDITNKRNSLLNSENYNI